MRIKKLPLDSIQIREEDIALFNYLFESKVATAQQIHRDIYANLNLGSVNNRLRKLEACELLKAKVCRDRSRQLAYSLTEKCFTKFVTFSDQKVIKQLDSAVLMHDLALVDIRSFLVKLPTVKSYFSENVLKTGILPPEINETLDLYAIRPDAMVKIETGKDSFYLPLEFEASRKFNKRYQELISKYYRAKSIQGILYICESEDLLKRIRTIESRVGTSEESKFFYSNFSLWRLGENPAFTNLKGSRLRLDL